MKADTAKHLSPSQQGRMQWVYKRELGRRPRAWMLKCFESGSTVLGAILSGTVVSGTNNIGCKRKIMNLHWLGMRWKNGVLSQTPLHRPPELPTNVFFARVT